MAAIRNNFWMRRRKKYKWWFVSRKGSSVSSFLRVSFNHIYTETGGIMNVKRDACVMPAKLYFVQLTILQTLGYFFNGIFKNVFGDDIMTIYLFLRFYLVFRYCALFFQRNIAALLVNCLETKKKGFCV